MIARNVSREQLEQAAAEVQVNLVGLHAVGRGWSFTLRTSDSAPTVPYRNNGGKLTQRPRYTARSYSGRLTAPHVCWHGHRDFLRALYRLAPDAKIRSAIATYESAEHFERSFPATGYRNVGSLYQPLDMHNACICGEGAE